MSVPAGVDMLIGAPTEDPPPALVQGLRERAQQHRALRAVYLFQLMIVAEGEEPHLTIGLDLDDGADVGAISNDLGGRAVETLPDGSALDVYPLPDDMLGTVAGSVDPIYLRES